MKQYCVFLRGINVGGNNLIKMSDLKKSFESIGLKNVIPILASGNIIFEADSLLDIKEKIEEKLMNEFGRNVNVIIRTKQEIEEIVKSNQFEKIKITPQIRLYITLLPKETEIPANLTLGFKIVKSTKLEIFSVLDLDQKSTDMMTTLDKKFGKNITTRSWNTIQKILEKMV